MGHLLRGRLSSARDGDAGRRGGPGALDRGEWAIRRAHRRESGPLPTVSTAFQQDLEGLIATGASRPRAVGAPRSRRGSGLVAVAVESAHLLDPRRAGDVDLGELAPDHVDPDEEEPVARGARGAAARRWPGRASSRVAFTARPPTWRLARISPSAGTRSRAPRGSPSTRRMRLSPSRTAGQVALGHGPAGAEARRLLEDREQVPIVADGRGRCPRRPCRRGASRSSRRPARP